MQKIPKLISLAIICFTPFAALSDTIPTIFGNIEEKNPVILSVLESGAMQRLKKIDQSGPDAYFTQDFPTFSRYDHSLGVYALLKRYGVSENEQLAGLLHDASHTVFSHVADVVFQNGSTRTDSYQDSIHEWYLERVGVDKVIGQHQLTISDILPKNPEFMALEQPYPDMNADRIEYNLHTGLILHDLTDQDVDAILANLRYDESKWYFTDVVLAKRFARISSYYTKAFWGSHRNAALYSVSAAMIKRAIELGIINKYDFHFGVDEEVVSKLKLSEDKKIMLMIEIMQNIDYHFEAADKQDFDVHMPIKNRAIDPLVLHDNDLVRLSELSFDYKHELDHTALYSKEGVYVKFKNINDFDLISFIKKSNY